MVSYRAFFSYARADDKVANWLHGQLDRYRTPKSLVGTRGALGVVPAKLHPIFRDRTDLQAGGHIDQSLQDALENSESLIVLCTPTSAKSHWVNHECETFLKLGRSNRIFPVVAAGAPDSGDPETECLPPALRGKSLLAADFREVRLSNGQLIGDGREGGRLKLIAGLLGVPLDALVLRERKRRRLMMASLGTATVLFAAVAFSALWFGWQSNLRRIEAEEQRALAQTRLEDTQTTVDDFTELLTRVDPRPRSSSSRIFSFSAGEPLPCVTDVTCSGDAAASSYEFNSILAVSGLAEGGSAFAEGSRTRYTPGPALNIFLQFCSMVESTIPDRHQSITTERYRDICARDESILSDRAFGRSFALGIAQVAPSIMVTQLSAPGYCGSGGCTTLFSVWLAPSVRYSIALECAGDAFTLRTTSEGVPITGYCVNRHRGGCSRGGYYFFTAAYVESTAGFSAGPDVYISETDQECDGEGTRVRPGESTSQYSPFTFFPSRLNE